MASLSDTPSPESAQASKKSVPNKVSEKEFRDALARITQGEIEWGTPAGSIDVFTKDEVVEIKYYKNWKNGVGQVKAYGEYYPSHQKRLHLFAHEGEKASKYFEMATKLCAKDGIRVTFEEVVSGSKNLGVHVVDGTDVFGISFTAFVGATPDTRGTGGATRGPYKTKPPPDEQQATFTFKYGQPMILMDTLNAIGEGGIGLVDAMSMDELKQLHKKVFDGSSGSR